MNRRFQPILAAALLMCVSSPALAQRNAGPMPQRPAFRSSRVFSGPQLRHSTVGTTGTTQASSFSNVVMLNEPDFTTLTSLLNPVPGLGFDYAHLAAVNRDLGVRALIDPVTQGQLALAERLLSETPQPPVFFPLFGGETVVAETPPQPQTPQVIIIQQPPASAPVRESAVEREPAAPAPPIEPLPVSGQLILVMKDGKRISAVGFTRQGNTIVYISPDGSRLSISLSDLDTETTTHLNEDRGTALPL